MCLTKPMKVGGGKKLSMAEAEASIEKFFDCRWLKLVEEGCLTVDVRKSFFKNSLSFTTVYHEIEV